MQCEVYIPEDNLGIQCHPCPRDVTRECADCGKKLCTSEAHIPASEVLEDAA